VRCVPSAKWRSSRMAPTMNRPSGEEAGSTKRANSRQGPASSDLGRPCVGGREFLRNPPMSTSGGGVKSRGASAVVDHGATGEGLWMCGVIWMRRRSVQSALACSMTACCAVVAGVGLGWIFDSSVRGGLPVDSGGSAYGAATPFARSPGHHEPGRSSSSRPRFAARRCRTGGPRTCPRRGARATWRPATEFWRWSGAYVASRVATQGQLTSVSRPVSRRRGSCPP
jgi:hypothetical protein